MLIFWCVLFGFLSMPMDIHFNSYVGFKYCSCTVIYYVSCCIQLRVFFHISDRAIINIFPVSIHVDGFLLPPCLCVFPCQLSADSGVWALIALIPMSLRGCHCKSLFLECLLSSVSPTWSL